MRAKLFYVFLLTFLSSLIFPHTHLLFFAPYLVLTFYKCTRFAVLWRAIGCGSLLDLFSSTPHFGLSALNYCIVCWILYGQTRNFFEDKASTLPLMTFFFSILSTLTSITLILFFSEPIPLSIKWVFTDLFCMPLYDATYAFLLYLPFQLTHHFRKVMRAKRRAR